tara:strand:- start:18 stop:155 length:138 start_codon:yes stop_codon:yes gene_type:complete
MRQKNAKHEANPGTEIPDNFNKEKRRQERENTKNQHWLPEQDSNL